MKKVFLLSVIACGLVFTSCKKETTKPEEEVSIEEQLEIVEKEAEDVDISEVETEEDEEETILIESPSYEVIVDITIPDFSDDRVEESLKKYVVYARDYVAAKGDEDKQAELAEEGKKITNDARSIVRFLKEDEQDKYAETIAMIQKKMTE
ncbi:hypothetical protein N9V96_02150 [Polaribacter sp.]|nr:hypothetical protein [Polaribacter sp.]